MSKKLRGPLIALAVFVVAMGLTAAILAWRWAADNGLSPNSAGNQGGVKPYLTDNQIVQDLAIIEKAVFDAPASWLPDDLQKVSVSGLNGRLQDYTYNVIQQYQEGAPPNQVFGLCAVFNDRSAKLDDPYFQYYYEYSSPEGYTYHNQGEQCFQIGWQVHAGASAITVLENRPDWAN